MEKKPQNPQNLQDPQNPIIMDDIDSILMEELDEILLEIEKDSMDLQAEEVPGAVQASEEKTGSTPEPSAESGKIPEINEDRTPVPAPLKGMKDPEKEEKKPEKQEEPPKPRKRFPWKAVLITLLSLVILGAAGAYGYGVHYYTEHFLPGTKAEGVALDNLTPEQADRQMTNSKITEDSLMKLTTKDGETVSMDTAPLKIRRHYLGLPEALENQDKWRFFLTVEEEKPVSLQYELVYDKNGAEAALKQLEICDPEKTEAPMDAYVYQDEKTGEWKIQKATDGDTLDLTILAPAVAKAVDDRSFEVDIADTGAYLTAQVREDDPDLNRRIYLENSLDAQKFTVLMGADTSREITSEEFRSLLREGIMEEKNPEFVLDEEKFDRFMESMARSYSTKSASGVRYFKSITGKRIAMKTEYGWDMDRPATSALVKVMMEEAGQKIFTDPALQETYPDHTVTAVWNQVALSHGERDIGESWVEVNITQQKMYCVLEGEIVLESDVVSGTETVKDRRTPDGWFFLKFKSTERDLVGYNPDGTESYRSHVHYWMPVYNNIGLHDATWRGYFGGKTYLYSGSHGCVNLPLKAAKELYGYVYKGMPVIFYRENKY